MKDDGPNDCTDVGSDDKPSDEKYCAFMYFGEDLVNVRLNLIRNKDPWAAQGYIKSVGRD